MSQTTEFTIGAEVTCEDGICGDVRRIVVDPIKRAITHLVVEPKHGKYMGRLVPVDLIDASPEQLRLRCTMAQFEVLEAAEETRLLKGATGVWDYDQDQMHTLPYFGLGADMTSLGMGGAGMGGVGLNAMGRGLGAMPKIVSYDKLPLGEVEVRRGQHVLATDGPIGRVRGLVIDPADYSVTHVLLDEGHLWGEKEVAIPISAVTGLDNGVHLNLTKDQVRDLPPVDIAHDG